MDDQNKSKSELISELQSLRRKVADSLPDMNAQLMLLKQSEERFRLGVVNAPFPIAIHANGQILHLSNSWTEISGYTREEIPTIDEWVKKAYGGATPHAATIRIIRNTYRLKNGEKQRNGEWQIVTKNGQKRVWDLSSASLGHHADGSNMIISMAVDITEKKQIQEALEESENSFRRLFENAPIAYQSLNMDGKFIEVNDAWLHMLGYQRDEVIGHHLQEFMAEEGFVRKTLPAFLEAGEIKLPGTALRCKDGALKIVHVDGRIGYNEQQQFVQTHCMLTDVTANAHLEAQLRQSQKMEALGSLAGGIAHDFNNMLAIILGNAELLMAKMQPQQTVEIGHLESILRAGNRSSELIKQILTFSRKEVVNREVVNMADIVSDSMRMLRSTIPANIEIRQNITESTHSVLANQSQINQIIVNLVTNAFHAMDAEGGLLTVALREIDCQSCPMDSCVAAGMSQCSQLVIEDNGHGISEEHLEQIFNPFFTTKEVGKGTGLGLPVIYGIVQTHGGAITVDSILGKGTRVTVCFPIIESQSVIQDDAHKLNIESAESASAVSRNYAHILVVEDETSLAELYHDFLSGEGYEVTVCNDGYEAVQVFAESPEKYDLVLTDQSMPNLTGKQLSQVLLKIRPDLPIIVGTGHSDVISEENYAANGISKFLQKPIPLTLLQQAIKDCLAL